MWFKNLQLYRLPAPWNLSIEQLEAALAKQPFQRAGSLDRESRGWIPPKDQDERLVITVGGHWLIALGGESKLLPSSVVNDYTREKVAEIEEKEGYRPGRKQVREIKERVTEELLPRAFTRKSRNQAWIDPQNGWLVVDAANPNKAEEVIEHLRKVLDDLPLRLLKTQMSPMAAMTAWLIADEAPTAFTVDRDCELRSELEEKATVRYVRHNLDTDEVKNHIVKDGKAPTRLAMSFDDRISFVLTEKLEVKKLGFLDVVKEQSEMAEGASEQFDADFALMTGELQRFLPALVEALGGEQADE